MKKIIISDDLRITNTDDTKDSFNMDPKGFFLIKVEDEKIKIGHVDNDTFTMTESFEGTDPFKLYKEIIKKDLISLPDHCAYLGYEIAKAKIAIQNKTEYVQE